MRRRRRIVVAAVALAALLVAVATWSRELNEPDRVVLVVERDTATIRGDVIVPAGVDAAGPAPAVIVAHGLGADRKDVAPMVRSLVRAGYVTLAYDSRGAGDSTGRVAIAGPDAEVADVSALVDELAARDDVQLDGRGDPRVAMVGTSYGGGVALLASARDERIDALATIFAWHDLQHALEPDGVMKLRWASELFASGSATRRTPDPCGNLEPRPCDAWNASARAGRFTPQARELLRERSASSVAADLDAPTLVVQGQMDSLFDLDEAVALARTLQRNRVPARVEWVRAGHDLPLDRRGREHVEVAVVRWLDRHLRRRGHVDAGPRFTVELGAGRGHAHSPTVPPVASTRALSLEPAVAVDAGGFVRLAVPAGGLPADVTTLPGLGDLTDIDTGFEPPPGQRARFRTPRVRRGLELVGTPRVRLQFTGSRSTAAAFVRLVDVAPDGRRIVPRGLVSAIRLEDLPPLGAARGRGVDVALPPIAWRLAPGHRFELEVSSTDAGYVLPDAPATLAVAPAGSGVLRLPLVDASDRSDDAFDGSRDWRDLLWIAALLVGLTLVAAAVTWRRIARRDARVQEPSLREVPLAARDLTKRFGDGRVAVDRVSLRVEAGTVVGLVGPNGAGKTTTLRMLLGLVHPSDGFAHVYGQRVRPGSPNLALVGALVEGPGLVPHLSGRDHLRRFWSAASGRTPDDGDIDAVLDAVDLRADADRPVRTWSHGMRQRLGIAQALLGERPLVVLDEPANGLDPAQIAHLRALVRSLADDGRAVLLSSHLLGELEQVCTHVVLMSEGRVLRAGTLDEVTAGHADLEAAFLALVAGTGGTGGDDA